MKNVDETFLQIKTFCVNLLHSVSGKEEQPGLKSKYEICTSEKKQRRDEKKRKRPCQRIAESDPKQTILEIYKPNTGVTAYIWQHVAGARQPKNE